MRVPFCLAQEHGPDPRTRCRHAAETCDQVHVVNGSHR